MAKTIITAALTGAVTPRGYQVPETPEQIAKEAYECWKAGASIVHLHMRDDQGMGVMDPVKFYETIRLIRAHEDCDVIINCTSSGDNRVSDDSPYGNAVRMLHHGNVPGIEMGTFDAGTFNWGIPGGIFSNSPTFLLSLIHIWWPRFSACWPFPTAPPGCCGGAASPLSPWSPCWRSGAVSGWSMSPWLSGRSRCFRPSPGPIPSPGR